LSDHSDDAFALPIAVGLGASLYERHLVLPDDADAIDRAVSSTPIELAAAIRAGRRAWSALGSGRKACLAAEAANMVASRRSLCAVTALEAGRVIVAADLIALRPATGVPPSSLSLVLGRQLVRPLAAGEPLTSSHLEALNLSETDRVA
jgi:sialic acid synthase SpsE